LGITNWIWDRQSWLNIPC